MSQDCTTDQIEPTGKSVALPTSTRRYTAKQMGDACEMLIAAELTLPRIPALKVPDNWRDYDVIAQPMAQPPQRISVKSHTYKKGSAYVEYRDTDRFDWLAIVLLPSNTAGLRLSYLVPRSVAYQVARRDKPTSKTAALRYYRIDEVERLFGSYRDNFSLSRPDDPPVSALPPVVRAEE